MMDRDKNRVITVIDKIDKAIYYLEVEYVKYIFKLWLKEWISE